MARILGLDEGGLRRVARDGRGVVRELHVGKGGERVGGVARKVETVGLAREGILASIGHLERPAVALRGEVAAHEDERDLHLAGLARVGRTVRELDQAEFRQFHVVFADIKDFVVALHRAEFDFAVHFCISLSVGQKNSTTRRRGGQ